MALAISSGCPRRPRGTRSAKAAFSCSASAFIRPLSPGVSITPGLTTFTRILRPFRSDVQVRANDRSAALVALYTLTASHPLDPTTEALRMIDAPWRSSGSAFCALFTAQKALPLLRQGAVKSAPFTLIAKCWSNASSVISPKGAATAMAALANTMSRWPFFSFTTANRRSRSARFETSPCMPVMLVPICFTAPSSSLWRRPVMNTYAPSATNCRAVASPIPLLPPVTSATFPSSFFMATDSLRVQRPGFNCYRNTQTGAPRDDLASHARSPVRRFREPLRTERRRLPPRPCSLSPALLPAHPLTDVRRTVPQLDALRFAGNEEAHDRHVNQGHLAQVENEQRPVPTDVGLEFVQVFGLDATDEPQRRGVAVGRRLDLQGHRDSSAMQGGQEQAARHGEALSRWAVGDGDAADLSAIADRSAWVGGRGADSRVREPRVCRCAGLSFSTRASGAGFRALPPLPKARRSVREMPRARSRSVPSHPRRAWSPDVPCA